jgi:hypothetical protein
MACPGGKFPAIAHEQGNDADRENIGKLLAIDIPYGTPNGGAW